MWSVLVFDEKGPAPFSVFDNQGCEFFFDNRIDADWRAATLNRNGIQSGKSVPYTVDSPAKLIAWLEVK